jgi:chromosome segregation ATPase
LDLYLENS